MTPRIETLNKKKLVGQNIQTSFTNNKTTQLWRNFMPRRKDIKDPVGTELYSVELYPDGFFEKFDPSRLFEKWAAIECQGVADNPPGMDTLIVPGGLYAVFRHTGPASNAAVTYNFIFREWLPVAAYELDQRPHFAVMGEKYKHEDESSEEEIWIPVRAKKKSS